MKRALLSFLTVIFLISSLVLSACNDSNNGKSSMGSSNNNSNITDNSQCGGVTDEDTHVDNENLGYRLLDNGTYAVSVGRSKSLSQITIPKSYKGKAVTMIAEEGFKNCEKLEAIEIPSSVTVIGMLAFENCSSLENVEIAEGMREIGHGAFLGCMSLENINIPQGVEIIGDSSFYCCQALTSIEIPASVTIVCDDAFRDCKSLTIYCEAQNLPSRWSKSWNASNCPVAWGHK
ncbi:MAG: leucine-rich repeat domain-containing protein [Ruminococcaceae bacterium]|nr:leucine-rich repeat domain-containing protein [Oscillospiraceae bacterium]